MAESKICGRDAVEACRLHLGEDDDLTIEAEEELAVTLIFQNNTDEAIELQERRVNTLAQNVGEIHLRTRLAVQSLCAAYARAKRFKDTEVQAQCCIKISKSLPQTNTCIVLNALHTLATCRQLSGDTRGAHETYLQSIHLEKDFYGGYTKDVLNGIRSLCKLCIESGDHKKAEPLLWELLAEAPAVFQEEQSDIIQIATHFLGHVCFADGRSEEATALFEKALGMARRSHIYDYGRFIDYTDHLVEIYIATGRFQDALEPAQEVMRYRQDILGAYHE